MPFFMKSKSKSFAPPTNWPPYHIKCSRAKCQYPNPPQVAPGTYTCKAGPRCHGVFDVSEPLASRTMRIFREERKRNDAKAQQITELQEAMRLRMERKYHEDEEAGRQAAAQVAAKYASESRAAKNGYTTPEQLQRHQPLERKAAQRKFKRHGAEDVPPDFHAYLRRPVALPPCRVAVQPQQPQVHDPPHRPVSSVPVSVSLVPVQYYPNPQPHIRGLPIPPSSSQSQVPLAHPTGYSHHERRRRQ